VVANFLYSRILFRFPRLKVVFAETSLAWGAYELERADHQCARQRLYPEGYDRLPSELFKRQCYLIGWFDSTGLKTRKYIGVDNLLWCTWKPAGVGCVVLRGIVWRFGRTAGVTRGRYRRKCWKTLP
jgi:uncharacterized protein